MIGLFLSGPAKVFLSGEEPEELSRHPRTQALGIRRLFRFQICTALNRKACDELTASIATLVC